MFNRPDLVKQTFPKIKEVKPKYLFLAADGPRKENQRDIPKCNECKEWVLAQIDWDCDVQTLFRDENLGCGLAVSSAITWFFENVEMGIILEDDIFAELSFFSFSQVLLLKFKNEKRVYGITGINWLDGKSFAASSYYFSSYPATWGWATWADRWEKFNFDIKMDDSFVKSEKFYQHWNVRGVKKQILDTFKQMGESDIWDYQWRYICFVCNGLIATPSISLTKNIGFGEDATHTNIKEGIKFNQPTGNLLTKLVHPSKIEVVQEAEVYMLKRNYVKDTTILKRLNKKLKKFWI